MNFYLKKKNTNHLLKGVSLFLLCILYIGAGINHFWHPQAYLNIIPPSFPSHNLINILSGIFEIIAGLLMLMPVTRKIAAYLIIALLIVFIPAHIYIINQNICLTKYFCGKEWAWIRLFPLQFILMWWAWKTYKWNEPVTEH